MMMTTIDLRLLIVAQLGMDVALIFLFVFLLRKMRVWTLMQKSELKLKRVESVLKDVDHIAEKFQAQLAEKSEHITRVNERMEHNMGRIQCLIEQAETLASTREAGPESMGSVAMPVRARKVRIMTLAGKGLGPAEIAARLSLPKEEVTLVLDLKKNQ